MNQAQVTAVSQAPTQSSVAQAIGSAFPQVKHVLMNRPQRGNALFAHTAAAFEALGLYRGESVTRNTLLRVWGETAVKYHASRFHRGEDGYSLNDEGYTFFGEQRKDADPEQAAGFFELLTTGKTDKPIHPSHRAVKPL